LVSIPTPAGDRLSDCRHRAIDSRMGHHAQELVEALPGQEPRPRSSCHLTKAP